MSKGTINMTKNINGNLVAQQVRNSLKTKITQWKNKYNAVPGLAVVLVGDRKDSATYVRYKEKAAEEIGMNFWLSKFPEDVNQTDVLRCIDKHNKDTSVNGIIVQLPLPSHLDEKLICESVALNKDVDGLRMMNLAHLADPQSVPNFVACTPQGCLELLKTTGINIQGKKAVVIGRSHIVGMPMALLLNKENATVTVCHSKTPSDLLTRELQNADIVVAAVGKPEMIKGAQLKEGAIVIDVGINPVEDATKKRGYRLVGDVDYNSAYQVASAITPVPGGVGPMTVAMLLRNTATGFERSFECSVSKQLD